MSSLRILVYLVIYDSGLVSREHLLLSRYPSQSQVTDPQQSVAGKVLPGRPVDWDLKELTINDVNIILTDDPRGVGACVDGNCTGYRATSLIRNDCAGALRCPWSWGHLSTG